MKTLNYFSISPETELRSSEMKLIRGGSKSGGIVRDEDILIPDPEPGDE